MQTNILALNKKILNHKFLILFFISILIVFFINTLHFSYPDEFENILGGFYIDHGRLPYTGFFTHHAPFAYFFASIITIFSGASFVKFRYLLAALYFGMVLGLYLYSRIRFGIKESNIFLIFITFLALIETYVWGQMLLADSLAGLLIIPAYAILFLIWFRDEEIETRDLILISILTSAGLLTSLTYAYAAVIIYLFTSLLYFQRAKQSLFSLKTAKFISILLAPFSVFLIYLLVTRSLGDFYYQAVFFNTEYYVTMPDGSPVHNPFRFALVIFDSFYNNFRAILTLAKDLNLSYPFADSLALSNLFLIIYLIIKRRIGLSLLLVGLLVYLNARSDPLTTSETDYQGIPYQYFSLFNGIFLLTHIWQDLKEKLEDGKKIVFGAMLLILGTYYLFLGLFLFDKGFDKAFRKYMGTQSLIYDRPAVANTLNSLLTPQDYYYIGPFAFEDHLYMKSKIATEYIVTIPAMDKSEKIKTEFISDIKMNRPKIIVFNTEYYIFGKKPGTFLVDFLKDNYFTLEQLKSQGLKFKINIGKLGDYDFERHFFFDKSRKDEIIQLLVHKGLITLS